MRAVILLSVNLPYLTIRDTRLKGSLLPPSIMTFPSYKPLTQHDRKLGVLLTAFGAAYFTVAASLIEENKISDDSNEAWLFMGSAPVLFFGGIVWLVLNSQYNGRAWSKLVISGCSSSGSAIGFAQLFFNVKPLIILGFAICAWAATIIVIVCRDIFRERNGDFDRAAWREEFIPEYAVGTPSDPAWYAHGRHAQPAGVFDEATSNRPEDLVWKLRT